MRDTLTTRGGFKGVTAGIRRAPGAWAAAALLIGLVLASFIAPLPHDPFATAGGSSLQPPSGEFWFGTDGTGADIFSRAIRAARVDLSLAMGGTALSLALGVPLGLAASTKGRWGERVVRGLDVFQAFPLLILAMALVTLSGNRLYMIVVAIALINIPRYMRILRSEVLSIREARFVEAAGALGASKWRITTRHILPNATGVVLAQTSLTLANAIVVISSLSFLGVGVSAPTPSWGSMIREGAGNMTSGEWWVAGFPGLMVVVCVLALNKIADSISDRTSRSFR